MGSAAARDIFVISDLHLGDGGPRDNFAIDGRPLQLHAFLDHVGAEGGELFILGDLLELWQMNVSQVVLKNRALLDHMAQLPLVYVPGNHDIDLVNFIATDMLSHPVFASMQRPFERRIAGRRFRFLHGHETDPFNASEEPGFGRMLTIFAGIFEDHNRSPLLTSGESVEAVLEQFGESMLALWTCAIATMGATAQGDAVEPRHALTPAQNPHRLAEHVAGVRAELERARHDVLILGHTHKPGRIGNWYHNSGSWTGPRNTFLRIATTGEVRHFEWKEDRALERAAPEILPEQDGPRNVWRQAVSSAKTLFPRPSRPGPSRLVLLAQGALTLSLGLWSLQVGNVAGWAAGFALLVRAFGAYALVHGGLSLWTSAREQSVKRLLQRLRGGVSILVGLVVLRRSDTPEVFVVLVGVWALLEGALRVAAAALFRRLLDSRWLWIVGVGSTIGGLALLLIPQTTVVLKYAVAIYLCSYGAGEILAGVFGQRK